MLEMFEKTKFAEKAECLARKFERYGLVTFAAWQNAPRRLGAKVCGEDTFSVRAELDRVANEEVDTIPTLDEAVEEEAEEESIFGVEFISESQAQVLASAGFMTVNDLKSADKEILTALEGIGEKTADKLLAAN